VVRGRYTHHPYPPPSSSLVPVFTASSNPIITTNATNNADHQQHHYRHYLYPYSALAVLVMCLLLG
jgi:hypothetical protein